MIKIQPEETSKGLAAVARSRQMRRQYTAIRPKAPHLSNAAKSEGAMLEPDVRRETAFNTALQNAGEQWPGCDDWEVIGADNLAEDDGTLMQPQIFGAFHAPWFEAQHEEQDNEDIGDGPG